MGANPWSLFQQAASGAASSASEDPNNPANRPTSTRTTGTPGTAPPDYATPPTANTGGPQPRTVADPAAPPPPAGFADATNGVLGKLGSDLAPAGTPDYSKPEAQTAWMQQQLQGTKYATDDVNYWTGRVNQTGGFTPANMAWWADKIKSGYFGSPEQVAAEAANNSTAGGNGAWGTYTPTKRDPQWDAFYQQLKDRADQSLAVSPNDPLIKNSTDAYKAQAQKTLTNQQEALAERGGAFATGAAANSGRTGGEALAQATAGYQAQQMTAEVTARRQEIAQALSQQGTMLTAEEQSRLTEEDHQLQGLQLQLQQATFDKNLAQQQWDNNYKSIFG